MTVVHRYPTFCLFLFFFLFVLIPLVLSNLEDENKFDLSVITSVGVKDSIYFSQKVYSFYFTLLFLQNFHINLSIKHILLLK